jgi:hypothetical protein
MSNETAADTRRSSPTPCSEIPEWLREIVSEGGKFSRSDENIPHVIKWVFDSHRQMCTDLQECVQLHNIGLPGESVDAIVIAELDRLLSQNVQDQAPAPK